MLKPHADIPGVDFVAFDDRFLGKQRDPDTWHLAWSRRAPDPALDPRLTAKYFKVVGPALEPRLADYDFTIWVDGSHEITSATFVEDVLADLGPNVFALHRHPNRDCVYDEATASIRLSKYAGQPIRAQVDAYRAEGHPEHAGLWATGTLVRRRSRELDDVMLDWWLEIERWTVQDQLSLPVVLRRHKFDPVPFSTCAVLGELCQLRSPWMRLHAHIDGTL